MASKKRWADRGLELLARSGFLARGIVYLVVGGVAARIAFLSHGRAIGPAGALHSILRAWNGRLALCLVEAGLLSFVFFRLVQARRAKTRLARVGYLVSALGIFVLALSAAGLLLGLRTGPDGEPLRRWGAWLVSRAWGRGALELGGAIAAVAGAIEAGRALLGRLPRDFTAALSVRQPRRWTYRLARVGVFAHGAVLLAVGLSVCRAGFDANARELFGTGGALRAVRVLHAPGIFVVAAAGLLAYGISLMVLAAHPRRRTL